MLKLTLCDVLEGEFVNLNRQHDLTQDSDEYKKVLSDAEDQIKITRAAAKDQHSYLDLMEKHLETLRVLESLRHLPHEDDTRKAAQCACDEAETPRMDRLLKILRTKQRSALCLSGGGIRSATFGLGVLQGLSHHHLLSKIDYLSTVSGGGYIGSWLSAWRTRHSLAEIEESLRAAPTKKLDGEVSQVEGLRSYSNYLSPELGLLSADSWTLVATVLRNMFLNWMLLVPMLAAALLIPELALSITVALPKNIWALLALLLTGSVSAVVAVSSVGKCLPSIGNETCTERDYLRYVLFPLALSAIFLNVFWVGWYRSGRDLPLPMYCYFGAILHLAGWVFVSDGARSLRRRGAQANYLAAIGDGVKALVNVHSGSLLLAAILTGAAGGWCAWAIASIDWFNPRLHPARIVCAAFPAVMAIYFVATSLFIGLASKKTDDEDREWWARSGGWILILASAWAAASVLVIGGPVLIAWAGVKISTAGGVAGLASGAVGSLIGKSDTSGTEKEKAGNDVAPVFSSAWFMKLALKAAPLIFLAVLLLGISELAQVILDKELAPAMHALPWVLHRTLAGIQQKLFAHTFVDPHPLKLIHDRFRIGFATPPDVRPYAVITLIAISAAIAWVMGRFVNVNTFSLHAMYRSRLIRAYLGASNPDREPNLFTGFDKHDNIRMHCLAPGRPFHVINAALNLVHGKRLAWQDRKAETFTITRLHSGSARVGYQRTAAYGDKPDPANPHTDDHKGITLGTAMAISGAAASPNMGYHSSPLLTFLMTFFNARLGWWLANPGYPGEGLWGERSPKSALQSLISEALGKTDDENPYVYLSDGGHFENLGIYEMILRRCDTIVVVDAGADPDYRFEDLANAIRKARVDLGVTVHFDKPLDMKSGMVAGNVHCAIGHIGYSCIDGAGATGGTLIYIKPVLEPTLSVDLDQYHSVNPGFPQQSTANQFFGEAQFESYRRLGLETIDSICEKDHPRKNMTVAQFVAAANAHSGVKKARAAC